MRFKPGLAAAFIAVIGCSGPEPRAPQISMEPWSKHTNALGLVASGRPLTLRESRESRSRAQYSLFPAYDDKLNNSIGKRWRDLTAALPRQPAGRVVLEFRTTFDGKVEDLRVADTNVPDNYVVPCMKAVIDGVPYDPWPEDMRQVIGRDYRDVRMGFQYK